MSNTIPNKQTPAQAPAPASKPKAVTPLQSQPKPDPQSRLNSAVNRLSDPNALGLTPLPNQNDQKDQAPTGPTEARKKELESTIRSDAVPTDRKTRDEMVDQAVASGNPELKKAMLDKLPKPPELSGDLSKIGEDYQKEVFNRSLKAYREGKKDSPLYGLGELFQVQTLGAEGGEFQGEIDHKKLGQKIDHLMKNDENLQDEMGKISREVTDRWRNSPAGRKSIQSQVDFMKSDGFQQRLRLLSPEDRDKTMSQELTKLALLAPERAAEVGQEVATKRFEKAQEYPLEGLSQLDQLTKEKAISEIVNQALGDTKTGTKAARDIIKELATLPASASRAQIVRRLQAHGLSPTSQGLTKVLGALGIVGLGADVAAGKFPTDIKTALSQAAALNSAGAAFAKPTAAGIARLAGAKNAIALKNMPKTLSLLKATRAFSSRAPVIGDALGTLIDGHSAFESFSKGDMAKGFTYTTAAGLGAVAMGLGIKAAAVGAVNGWNPFGWAALGVGLTATGVGLVASQMDGKDEKLVKRLGLFDPAAAVHYAIDGLGTNDGQLIRALSGKSEAEMARIRAVYLQRYGKSLDDAIKGDTSGHYEDALLVAARGQQQVKNYNPSGDARALETAMRGWGTDEDALRQIILRKSPEDLRKLAEAFRARTGGSLIDWVEGDTSGNFERTLVNALRNAGVR